MKRLISLCLVLVLCLGLCACGARIGEEEAIVIALEEAGQYTSVELTADMAVCEELPGQYRVTFNPVGVNVGYEVYIAITLDAKTGEVLEIRMDN